MIFKILIFLIVMFLIYLVFFKKSRPNLKKSSKKLDAQTLVECETCNTFVSVNEAIIKNAKYYCSKECAKK